MMNKVLIYLLFTFNFTAILCLSAQEKSKAFKVDQALIIKTQDGSELRGRFVSEDDEYIVLVNEALGQVKILKSNIESITEVDPLKIGLDAKPEDDVWFKNPNPTRYLIAPSAIPMKKGDRYYQNIYVVLSGIQYGVSDRFSIGGGVSVTSLFGLPAFYLTPKYTLYSKDLYHLSVGAIMFVVAPSWELDAEFVGIAYLSGTIGNVEHNVSLGLGWGFINDELADLPIINISGQTRVMRKLSLITENWIIPNIEFDQSYYGVYSYGVRFLRDDASIDLTMINNPDIYTFSRLGVPYLGFMLKF